jgi:alkylation response protein AidB-like acyl-CoA dehydrogenase
MPEIAADPDAGQLQMLRESAADFVRRSADMKRLRERRGTLPGHDPAHLRQMVELGWFGLLVPEANGGLGLGLPEMAAVLEELGRGLMADPLTPAAFATRVLHHAARAGNALAGTLLSQVADGTLLPAVAWQEGLGGIDTADMNTHAEADGAGWRLGGRKRFVAGAAAAGGFVVSARTPAGPGLFWVAAHAPGVALTHEWRADQTPSGVLDLAEVRVAPQHVLAPGAGDGEASLSPLARAFDDACVLAAAEMLGVAEAALAMALAYMRTRVQFGKPIGSFQALQHKAADLYVQQELLRAVLEDAVRTLAADRGATAAAARERAMTASRCKARACDAGLRITREVIQVHGAIGFTDEYDAGLYLKRALVLAAWLGNAGAHRARFAALHEATAAL